MVCPFHIRYLPDDSDEWKEEDVGSRRRRRTTGVLLCMGGAAAINHQSRSPLCPPAPVLLSRRFPRRTQIGIINMIASNQDKLGVAHAICPGIEPDDGRLCLAIIDDSNSRTDTVRAAMTLKQGGYLAEHPNVRKLLVREIILDPKPDTKACTIPINIDGDPHPASKLHVKVGWPLAHASPPSLSPSIFSCLDALFYCRFSTSFLMPMRMLLQPAQASRPEPAPAPAPTRWPHSSIKQKSIFSFTSFAHQRAAPL